MFNKRNRTDPKFPLIIYLALLFSFSACSDKELHPEDVEYRKDENGTEILYQLGKEEPFGKGKRAYIVGHHQNGNDQFRIGFVNGFKDGNFTFWQENKLKLLTGSYKIGKRDGKFTAHGKIGELIYEKEFKDGELNGAFKLYYPSSPSDVLRYFKKLKEEEMLHLGEEKKEYLFGLISWSAEHLEVKSHLRLDATFSDGQPNGPYSAYYHPRGKILTPEELIREEGYFDKNGMLSEEQHFYFPQTHALVVIMPDNKRLETMHPASSDGFSRAIDEAAKEILEIPSYRNPNNAPALVYAIDERGNEIIPIWSSHIKEIAIRNMDDFLLTARFKPTYEKFVFEAMNLANETLLAIDTNLDLETLAKFDQEGAAVEIVGLDKNGKIIDILWSSRQTVEVVPLDERIDRKRKKLKRTWQQGKASEAHWLLSNGSRINIKDQSSHSDSFRFLR